MRQNGPFSMRRLRGFTVVELLVVIAIIAVIAAFLLPVFNSVRSNARHIAWMDSTRQLSTASQLYLADYDDTFMIPRHHFQGSASENNDRTWVQSMLPYLRNFNLLLCPVDTTRESDLMVFDPDLGPGDPDRRYYEASKRVNLGYNYTYLSPVVQRSQGWVPFPRSTGSVENPSATLMFGDSAWELVNGQPRGGGNYLIIPPCRYMVSSAGVVEDSFDLPGVADWRVFTGGLTWQSNEQNELWPSQAGGLYPWFKTSITIAFVDGHVERKRLSYVTDGCSVEGHWGGYIYDTTQYVWDLR